MNKKRKFRTRILSLAVAITMFFQLPIHKNKGSFFNALEDMYNKYIKRIVLNENEEKTVFNEKDIAFEELSKTTEEIAVSNEQEMPELNIVIDEEMLENSIVKEIDNVINEEQKLVEVIDNAMNEESNIIEEIVNIVDVQPVESQVIEETPKVEEEEKLKRVALTFDDGPSKYTEELLQILKEYNASATFFVVGSRIQKYGDVIEKIKEDGHQIGSHGINHEDFTKVSTEELKNILEETKNLLEQHGITQTLVRPPYGSINKTVRENIGYPIILWSIDTRDWEHRDSEKGAQIIIEDIESGSIILMHDLYQSTIEMVRKVLPILKEQGYEFVTVEQLFEDVELEKGKTYYKKIK